MKTQFEKIFLLMKKPSVIVAYVILVILSYHFVDRALATYLYQFNLRQNLHILSTLSSLGIWEIYVVLSFFAAMYFRYVRKNLIYEKKAWYVLICVFLATLVCFVLKVTLSRARPDLLFSKGYYGFYWFKLSSKYWSLPSGHTTTIVSLAASLGILFPRYFYAALAIALAVVATRVLLYHHYLSDVMSAAYISLLVVGFLTQYIKMFNPLKLKKAFKA